jgi:sec-independent protein translocase protein TatB
MLDFGFSEILLTSAIALVVLGPEKLPKVARQVGNWMGRARLMARQLSEQLEREVNAEELLKQTKSSIPTSPAVLPAATEPTEAAAVPAVRREPHPTSAAAMHPTSAAAMHPDSAAAMHPATPPTQTSAEPQQSTQ